MNKVKRGVGRPVRPVLNRKMIAEHALALATESGFERLTMNQLAQTMGVAASALYNHIDSKADLILLIQDALVSQVSVQGMRHLLECKVPLEIALEDWARSYRKVFAAYPSLIPLIAVTPVSEAPQTSRMYNIVSEGLLSAGIPAEEIINVIVAFESFLFGSALDINAPTNVLDAPEGDMWLAHAVNTSRKVTDPTAEAEGTESPPLMNNVYAEAPFHFGLQALIGHTLRITAPNASNM